MRPAAIEDQVHEVAIDGYLRALKMPGALREYKELVREARETGTDALVFLEALLAREMDNRRANQVAQRLRDARFPYPKDLESFDFTANPEIPKSRVLDLCRAAFVDARENVILLGASGTGKTHLAIAVARATIFQGHRARYTTATALMNELLAAQANFELAKVLRTWNRYDTVVIDEVGYTPFSQDGARLLFQFFADMYERRSLILTTNLEFSQWVTVFGEPTMTSALLDRVTHRAHIIPTGKDSYRLRQARARSQSEGGFG
jgi:DNA replication protein DnaC